MIKSIKISLWFSAAYLVITGLLCFGFHIIPSDVALTLFLIIGCWIILTSTLSWAAENMKKNGDLPDRLYGKAVDPKIAFEFYLYQYKLLGYASIIAETITIIIGAASIFTNINTDGFLYLELGLFALSSIGAHVISLQKFRKILFIEQLKEKSAEAKV
jgi:hypothetical protein